MNGKAKEKGKREMKRISWLIVLVCLVWLGGCATVPIHPDDAQPVPNDRILAFQQKTSSATSTLIVTRDEGFLGGGCFLAFSINGILAARFDPSETSKFYLESGETLLQVDWDPQGRGLCSPNIKWDNPTQRETILRPNETKYFRLAIDLSGKPDIQRSEFTKKKAGGK